MLTVFSLLFNLLPSAYNSALLSLAYCLQLNIQLTAFSLLFSSLSSAYYLQLTAFSLLSSAYYLQLSPRQLFIPSGCRCHQLTLQLYCLQLNLQLTAFSLLFNLQSSAYCLQLITFNLLPSAYYL
nr:hypothetical protein CFP56_23407 [Quercus suber]